MLSVGRGMCSCHDRCLVSRHIFRSLHINVDVLHDWVAASARVRRVFPARSLATRRREKSYILARSVHARPATRLVINHSLLSSLKPGHPWPPGLSRIAANGQWTLCTVSSSLSSAGPSKFCAVIYAVVSISARYGRLILRLTFVIKNTAFG